MSAIAEFRRFIIVNGDGVKQAEVVQFSSGYFAVDAFNTVRIYTEKEFNIMLNDLLIWRLKEIDRKQVLG